MSIAPDPTSFAGAESVFDYLVPSSAVEIVLPAFTFGGPAQRLSHLIYMNQCNPASIMATGAMWLQLAEKYFDAGTRLDGRVDGLGAESWDGKDRTAFEAHAGKVSTQLVTVAAFALEVGVSLMAIGAILAALVTAMAAFATALFAMAVAYWAAQAIPVYGQAAGQAIRGAATAVGGVGYTVVKALDTVVSAAGATLAAFIGGGMGASWGVLASQGNVVDPLKVAGPALTSFVEGYVQFFARNRMAPGGGKHSAFDFSNLFMGGQGAYNLGMNHDENEGGGADGLRDDVGADPGNLDFIPDFDKPDWLEDPAAPGWR